MHHIQNKSVIPENIICQYRQHIYILKLVLEYMFTAPFDDTLYICTSITFLRMFLVFLRICRKIKYPPVRFFHADFPVLL